MTDLDMFNCSDFLNLFPIDIFKLNRSNISLKQYQCIQKVFYSELRKD